MRRPIRPAGFPRIARQGSRKQKRVRPSVGIVMLRRVAAVLVPLLAGPAFTQPPAPPELPPSTSFQSVTPNPLAPAEPPRQREATIAALKEDLTTFNPVTMVA